MLKTAHNQAGSWHSVPVGEMRPLLCEGFVAVLCFLFFLSHAFQRSEKLKLSGLSGPRCEEGAGPGVINREGWTQCWLCFSNNSSSEELTILSGTPCPAHRSSCGNCKAQCYQAGADLILVVTEMTCPVIIQSQREERNEDQSWHLLPWPRGLTPPHSFLSSTPVSPQRLALEKVGQGRPALSCSPLL